MGSSGAAPDRPGTVRRVGSGPGPSSRRRRPRPHPSPPGGEIAQWDAAILALLARTERSRRGPRRRVPSRRPVRLGHAGAGRRSARPSPSGCCDRCRDAATGTPSSGTAFHAWVEARLGVQPLITDDDLPGRGRRVDRLARRAGRAQGGLRAPRARPAHARRAGGPVRARDRGPADPRAHRRRVPGRPGRAAGSALGGRRLEDLRARRGRPPAAGDLPGRLGRPGEASRSRRWAQPSCSSGRGPCLRPDGPAGRGGDRGAPGGDGSRRWSSGISVEEVVALGSALRVPGSPRPARSGR